jgi:hypothetical protein
LIGSKPKNQWGFQERKKQKKGNTQMKVTIKHFALVLGVDYTVAAGFMKVLESRNSAKKTGEFFYTGKKGSNIYEVDDTFTINLKALYNVVPKPVNAIPEPKQPKERKTKPKPEPILNEAGEVVKKKRGRPVGWRKNKPTEVKESNTEAENFVKIATESVLEDEDNFEAGAEVEAMEEMAIAE